MLIYVENMTDQDVGEMLGEAAAAGLKAVMKNLVRRYVTQQQRKAENEGVTEDDVNEIKNDISAFRFELIEIMRASGMNTQSASGPSGGCICTIFLSVNVILWRSWW